MKKKGAVIFAVLTLYLLFSSFTYAPLAASAPSDAENELNENVQDIVDNLDLSEWEAYLATLTDSFR